MMRFIVLMFVFTLSLFAQTQSVIKVEGMHCPLCTTAVKKAIKTLDGIEKVSARLNTKKVTVTYDEEKVSLKAILDAIQTTSYEGVVLTKTKQ